MKRCLYTIAPTFVLCVTAALLLTTVAHAAPTVEITRIYLDDNGNEVGFFFWGCYGAPQMTGQSTTNIIFEAGDHCGDLLTNATCYWDPDVTLDPSCNQGDPCDGGEVHVSCGTSLFYSTCTDYFGSALCNS